MKKIFIFVLALSGAPFAQVSPLVIPYVLDSATTPQVRYIDYNNTAIKNTVNELIDVVNNINIFDSLSVANIVSDSLHSSQTKINVSKVTADTLISPMLTESLDSKLSIPPWSGSFPGGYPKGAVVHAPATDFYYVSLIDNNASNIIGDPDMWHEYTSFELLLQSVFAALME